MDVTGAFRSSVQSRKHIDTSLGLTSGAKNLLSKPRKKCEFIQRCKELLVEISRLRDFLLEHRKAYLNLSPSFIRSEQMSEEERDDIDTGAQHIIKTCSQLLLNFRRELQSIEKYNQAMENRKAVVDLLDAYLKNVCKIYTEQKAIRVKWSAEVEKMSKLEAEVEKDENDEEVEQILSSKTESSSPAGVISYAFADDTQQLSEEELQMFEMENQTLYNDLNSLNEEVRAIQSKVVKIAELQEVFTDKVLEQNEDIERISTTLVGTTENLKDANTQIRQAIQSNASFRIYVLFFILVMSFSLLFLDWYND